MYMYVHVHVYTHVHMHTDCMQTMVEFYYRHTVHVHVVGALP